MSRRLILFGLLAAAQLSTGCWCVRERIAWRWHNRPGIGCAPACGPVCNATPAFRIPSPVVGMPVSAGPVVSWWPDSPLVTVTIFTSCPSSRYTVISPPQ